MLYANRVLHKLFVRPVMRFEDGSRAVRERLEQRSPCMIARFGAIEIKAVVLPLLPRPLPLLLLLLRPRRRPRRRCHCCRHRCRHHRRRRRRRRCHRRYHCCPRRSHKRSAFQ